jgi:hypothetical protein
MRLQGIYVLLNLIIMLIMIEVVAISFVWIQAFF